MKATYKDGMLQIRGESTEEKPAEGTVIEATDSRTDALIKVAVSVNDLFLEEDTGEFQYLGGSGWATVGG